MLQFHVYPPHVYTQYKVPPGMFDLWYCPVLLFASGWMKLSLPIQRSRTAASLFLCLCVLCIYVSHTQQGDGLCAATTGVMERHRHLWPQSRGHISIAPFFAFILPHQKRPERKLAVAVLRGMGGHSDIQQVECLAHGVEINWYIFLFNIILLQ